MAVRGGGQATAARTAAAADAERLSAPLVARGTRVERSSLPRWPVAAPLLLAAGAAALLLCGPPLPVSAGPAHVTGTGPRPATEAQALYATAAPQTQEEARRGQMACMVALAGVFGVVFSCVAVAGFFRESTKDPIVRRLTDSSELDKSDLWENRDALIKFTKDSLKAERHADMSCFGLFFNRPWKKSPGAEVVAPKLSSNSEWMEGKPFPDGETRTQDEAAMVRAFWRFMSRKKRYDTLKCSALMVVQGVCPAATAQLLALIADEITGPGGSERKLMVFCICLLAVNLLQSRAYYMYEIDVPGASVRWELNERLQRQFLGMRGATAKAWSPGRCAAVMDFDVIQAVNLTWESLFVLVQTITNFVALTAVMLYNNSTTRRMLITSALMLVVLFTGAFANLKLRQPNCLELAKRKRDWELAMMGLCTKQITENREGKKLRSEDEAAAVFGDCALVYRKRSFHYFFIRLVAALACAEMTFFCQATIAFVAGRETMQQQMTVGQAVALIAVVNMLSTQLAGFVNAQLDILEGYASLLDICEVMNAEEVV